MKNVALKIDGLTFRPIASDVVDESLELLRKLYKEKTDWHGRFIKLAWKIAAGRFSRVQDWIKDENNVFWRWGLRASTEGGIIFILLPEPGDSDESITIYVEENADDDKIAEEILELLLKFTNKLEQEIWLSQKKGTYPQQSIKSLHQNGV